MDTPAVAEVNHQDNRRTTPRPAGGGGSGEIRIASMNLGGGGRYKIPILVQWAILNNIDILTLQEHGFDREDNIDRTTGPATTVAWTPATRAEGGPPSGGTAILLTSTRLDSECCSLKTTWGNRGCMIRVRLKERDHVPIRILCWYMPTGADHQQVAYEQTCAILDDLPNTQNLLIAGDTNATLEDHDRNGPRLHRIDHHPGLWGMTDVGRLATTDASSPLAMTYTRRQCNNRDAHSDATDCAPTSECAMSRIDHFLYDDSMCNFDVTGYSLHGDTEISIITDHRCICTTLTVEGTRLQDIPGVGVARQERRARLLMLRGMAPAEQRETIDQIAESLGTEADLTPLDTMATKQQLDEAWHYITTLMHRRIGSVVGTWWAERRGKRRLRTSAAPEDAMFDKLLRKLASNPRRRSKAGWARLARRVDKLIEMTGAQGTANTGLTRAREALDDLAQPQVEEGATAQLSSTTRRILHRERRRCNRRHAMARCRSIRKDRTDLFDEKKSSAWYKAVKCNHRQSQSGWTAALGRPIAQTISDTVSRYQSMHSPPDGEASFDDMQGDDTTMCPTMLVTDEEMISAAKQGALQKGTTDGLTEKYFQWLPDNLREAIRIMLTIAVCTGRMPSSWTSSNIVLVPKGDGRHRPVCLLSSGYRLLQRVVLNRVRAWQRDANFQHHAAQHGFTDGRSCTEALILGRLLHEQYVAMGGGKPLYTLLVDASNAFNRVSQQQLAARLQAALPRELYNTIINTMTGLRSSIKIDTGLYTTTFPIHRGVMQGSPTSPELFLYAMDSVLNKVYTAAEQQGDGGILPGVLCRVPAIALADDVKLLSGSIAGLQRIADTAKTATESMGINWNAAKTKLVVMGKPPTHTEEDANIMIDGIRVTASKYGKDLGVMTSPDRSFNNDNLLRRIDRATAVCSTQRITLREAATLARTVIQPAVLYHATPLYDGRNEKVYAQLDVRVRRYLRNRSKLNRGTANEAIHYMTKVMRMGARVRNNFLSALDRVLHAPRLMRIRKNGAPTLTGSIAGAALKRIWYGNADGAFMCAVRQAGKSADTELKLIEAKGMRLAIGARSAMAGCGYTHDTLATTGDTVGNFDVDPQHGLTIKVGRVLRCNKYNDTMAVNYLALGEFQYHFEIRPTSRADFGNYDSDSTSDESTTTDNRVSSPDEDNDIVDTPSHEPCYIQSNGTDWRVTWQRRDSMRRLPDGAVKYEVVRNADFEATEAYTLSNKVNEIVPQMLTTDATRKALSNETRGNYTCTVTGYARLNDTRPPTDGWLALLHLKVLNNRGAAAARTLQQHVLLLQQEYMRSIDNGVDDLDKEIARIKAMLSAGRTAKEHHVKMSDVLLRYKAHTPEIGYLDGADEIREALRCAEERIDTTPTVCTRSEGARPHRVDVDGSKDEDGRAGAGVASNMTMPRLIAAGLNDHNTRIGTKRCELAAMAMALLLLPHDQPIQIYCDNKGAVSALHNLINKTTPMYRPGDAAITAVVALGLAARTAHTSVHWVKGHSGDKGNDEADLAAKAGRDNQMQGIAIEAIALSVIKRDTWAKVRELHPATPATVVTTSFGLSTQSVLATANKRAYDGLLHDWGNRHLKHGWSIRNLGMVTTESTRTACLGRAASQEHVKRRPDGPKAAYSLSFLTRLMCLDLPVQDTLHRHESHPEQDADLQGKCCRCLDEADGRAETMRHALYECKAITRDLHAHCWRQHNIVTEDDYDPGPLAKTAIGIDDDKNKREDARHLCSSIWHERNNALREWRRSQRTSSTQAEHCPPASVRSQGFPA